jgi:hypothetical protein
MLIQGSSQRPTISILKIGIGIIILDTSVKFLIVGISGHNLPDEELRLDESHQARELIKK